MPNTPIDFDLWMRSGPDDSCFSDFENRVRTLARQSGGAVGDLGGGANPLLELPFIRKQLIDYSVFDVSAEELAKAPEGYRTIVADLSSEAPMTATLDLAFSKTVCEHLRSPDRFHRNVYEMLKPGGRAVHFFPTLYSPPFLINRAMPESLGNAILERLNPKRRKGGAHSKFPASYRWCRGPSTRQLNRFRRLGYTVCSYRAYFGHSYYRTLPVLPRVSRPIAQWLTSHPSSALTSYAIVELERPLR